jgi:hypothetical protein
MVAREHLPFARFHAFLPDAGLDSWDWLTMPV